MLENRPAAAGSPPRPLGGLFAGDPAGGLEHII